MKYLAFLLCCLAPLLVPAGRQVRAFRREQARREKWRLEIARGMTSKRVEEWSEKRGGER